MPGVHDRPQLPGYASHAPIRRVGRRRYSPDVQPHRRHVPTPTNAPLPRAVALRRCDQSSAAPVRIGRAWPWRAWISASFQVSSESGTDRTPGSAVHGMAVRHLHHSDLPKTADILSRCSVKIGWEMSPPLHTPPISVPHPTRTDTSLARGGTRPQPRQHACITRRRIADKAPLVMACFDDKGVRYLVSDIGRMSQSYVKSASPLGEARRSAGYLRQACGSWRPTTPQAGRINLELMMTIAAHRHASRLCRNSGIARPPHAAQLVSCPAAVSRPHRLKSPSRIALEPGRGRPQGAPAALATEIREACTWAMTYPRPTVIAPWAWQRSDRRMPLA